MTTEKFIGYLKENLIKDNKSLENKLQIDQWVYEPGLPENCPFIQSDEFIKIENQISDWLNGTPAKKLNTENWTTHHWLHFLRKMPETINNEQMVELDGVFQFTKSANSEILSLWLQIAIENHYEQAFPVLEKFLIGMGRRKFLKPIYEKLAKTQEGMKLAKQIYQRARPTYHAVSYTTIDKILSGEGS